jgi:hypothetical protein
MKMNEKKLKKRIWKESRIKKDQEKGRQEERKK